VIGQINFGPASAKHEALLMTDPENLDLPIEKLLP
jgi:hypothetical protein